MDVHTAGPISDSEIASLLSGRHWTAVAVVTRDDVLALRLTLLSAHLRPDLPLWVTMFDRTITRELAHVAPSVHVLSPSELVADDLAEHCAAIRAAAGEPRHGASGWSIDALRLLVRAGAGLLIVLLVEALIAMIALHEGVIDALYFSTRSVATVASAPGAAPRPDGSSSSQRSTRWRRSC